MQLINASVYQQRAQARQTEIEESTKKRAQDRLAKRDTLERARLYSWMKDRGQGNKVNVSGGDYRVTCGGDKLERIQGGRICGVRLM
jgi:hypothetical protein